MQRGEHRPPGDGEQVGDLPRGVGGGLALRRVEDAHRAVVGEHADGALAGAQEALEALVRRGGPRGVLGGGIEGDVGRDDHPEEDDRGPVEVAEGEVGLDAHAAVEGQREVGRERVPVEERRVGPAKHLAQGPYGVAQGAVGHVLGEGGLDLNDGLCRGRPGLGEHAGREEQPGGLHHAEPLLMGANAGVEGHRVA
ncbi:MAG: hypothetical protein IPN17_31385 [Deltaproteobacteria bacterium]|nr:hypothetical protein [Deltaproteobacteria bacterium]